MSLDPHHVHNFWGTSPALDVRAAVERCRAAAGASARGDDGDAASCSGRGGSSFATLLLGTSDPRHVFQTLARSRRHAPRLDLTFHVYESNMVETARHVLLLCVLMTDDVPPSERAERFLEIFMNATVRDSTAELIERFAQRLERVVGAMFAGEAADDPAIANDPIARVFDFGLLKFKEKDELMDAFRSWSRRVPFDMPAALDRRARKYYGDRFDHRKNMVDWDYHMRLDHASPNASVIHFKHFAHWRLAGIAYPVREATFPAPNRTLVGYATGTTKEYKDRNLDDRGRTIASRGFWGDQLNGPFAAYGVEAEEPALFKVANRQRVKTAVDVSEYNVACNLYELRAGAPWKKKKASSDPDAADAINAWMPDEGMAPGDGGGDGTDANAWEGSDGAAFAAAWRSLTIRVVGPTDFEKTFASRAKHAGAFDAIVVGAWKAQMVTPALGALARPDGGVLALEGSEYFVAADKKADAAFAAKAAALARDAGFEAVASAKAEGDAAKEEEGAEGAGILPGVDAAHRFFIRGAHGKE